jgi:hypothetical protein
MKRISEIAAMLMVGILGCHAQVPQPSTSGISLACTAPASCTAAGAASCQYVFARATCATATSCPANTAGNTNFAALNAATPSATCSYLDQAPPANSLVIYTVSTLQGGLTSQPSAPSNSGVPMSIPAQPGQPGGLSGTEQAALAPPLAPNAKPAPAFAKKSSPPAGLIALLPIERNQP